MSWPLHTGFRDYVILDRTTVPELAACEKIGDADSARRFLSQFQNDCFCMATLRDLLACHGCVHDLCRWNDGRILQCVAWELALGRLRIAEEAHRVISGAGRRETAEAEEAAWPPPEVEPEVETKTAWIEIELVGEDDKPIPGERYVIKKPDGTPVASGWLDEDGYAYKGRLESGTYLVSFPDLDEEAWEKI